MSESASPAQHATCTGCGFTAPAGSDEWAVAEHPSLGALTRCPECGSTDVHNRG